MTIAASAITDDDEAPMTLRTTPNGPSIAFERSYATALGRHVRSAATPDAGDRIGRRARGLGLETLTLARIHERAVAALPAPNGRRAISAAREAAFFADAVAPLAEAESGAPEALAECTRLAALLSRRMRELAAVRIRLQRETERCTTAQTELTTCEQHQVTLLTRSRIMEERLRRLSHRLLSAQEEERMRISRDLHDAIGQTLTGINVGLATLKNEAAADSRSLDEAIVLTQQLVERSMKTVHQFAWELRPTLLDDLGLVAALRSYARTYSERTGVKVRFSSDDGPERLDGDRRTALFRVAQGALSNVERHARSSRATVVLRTLPGAVRLEVRDHGRSFDVGKMETSRSNRHLGLLVMRERVEMVGGSFSIRSSPGRGTTVRADVPIEAVNRD